MTICDNLSRNDLVQQDRLTPNKGAPGMSKAEQEDFASSCGMSADWPPLLEFDLETDGRHIAEAPKLSGCLAYGETRQEAERACLKLALEHLHALGQSVAKRPSATR